VPTVLSPTQAAFPHLRAVATTLRNAKTATLNDWGAILYVDGQFYEAPLRENLEIYDRVGGGDSFASGLIYAFLADRRRSNMAQRTAPWP
jgi:2-dehydro-3-deoxygluconokinase